MGAIQTLWEQLHACPALSWQEQSSISILKHFFHSHTSLEVYPLAGGLIAAHREPAGPTVAVRADLDAIPNSQGKPYHGCGHDGHSAILAGLAQSLEGRRLGKSVLFVFQPAEEVGGGAQPLCQALLEQEGGIDAMLGFHNIPGYPEGKLLLRPGAMACASEGLTVTAQGAQCHAAYPERGLNPGPLLCDLVLALPQLIQQANASGLLMATLVELRLGNRNFGVSPGQGELCLTLRAHRQQDLQTLEESIRDYAKQHAHGVCCSFQLQDVFPDTTNDPGLLQRCREIIRKQEIPYQELAEPMRWSEDFGWYAKRIPACFFGFGAGESWPELHTEEYCFNTSLFQPCIHTLQQLIQGL